MSVQANVSSARVPYGHAIHAAIAPPQKHLGDSFFDIRDVQTIAHNVSSKPQRPLAQYSQPVFQTKENGPWRDGHSGAIIGNITSKGEIKGAAQLHS